MTTTIRAMPSARAGTASQRSPQAVSGIAAIPIALSDIMRTERIVGIHWDPLLDRFTVDLRDYSCGGGATVGEALTNAKARSAAR